VCPSRCIEDHVMSSRRDAVVVPHWSDDTTGLDVRRRASLTVRCAVSSKR
jgi:hypothetical protein